MMRCAARSVLVGWCGLAAAFPLAGFPPALGEDLTWEHRPYRISVGIHFSPSHAFSEPHRRQIIGAVASRLATLGRAAWRVEVEELPLPPPAVHCAVDDSAPPWGDDPARPACDKRFHVAVVQDDPAIALRVVEWDDYVQRWGQSFSVTFPTRRFLADQASRLVANAFSPVALIHAVDGQRVTLRMRAASLAGTGEAGLPLAQGDIMLPLIRRGGPSLSTDPATSVREVPWTLLEIEDFDGETATAVLHSGMRSPLSTRIRGGVELIALLVRPRCDSTRLKLVGPGGEPLEGYGVFARDAQQGTLPLGTTTQEGTLEIPRNPPGGLKVLFIKSGERILARLPLLVGYRGEITVPLPDDRRRLEVEGFVTGFQEKVIDTFARREVLIARIEQLLQRGDREGARALLARLKRLPSQYELQGELNQHRLQSAPRALDEPQVARLFADTETLLIRYLPAGPVEDLETRVLGGPELSPHSSVP